MEWQRLGKEVVAQRNRLGYATREAFAQASKISSRILSDIENGNRSGYHRSTLIKLEQALLWAEGSVDAVLQGGDATSGAFEKGKADARARYGPSGEPAGEGFDLDPAEVPTIGMLARSGLPGPYRAILGARLAEWQAELAVDLNKTIAGIHKYLDGPYHPGPGREFRPANLLEMKMLIWRCTPAARRQPAWQLLVAIAQAAAVYIPVPAGADAAPLGDDFPWQFEIRHNESGEPAGRRLLVIFTSPERMRDYLPDGFDAVPVKLQDLVPVWPGDALPYFNPASPISLLGSGVDNLADVVRLVGSAERRNDPLGEFD